MRRRTGLIHSTQTTGTRNLRRCSSQLTYDHSFTRAAHPSPFSSSLTTCFREPARSSGIITIASLKAYWTSFLILDWTELNFSSVCSIIFHFDMFSYDYDLMPFRPLYCFQNLFLLQHHGVTRGSSESFLRTMLARTSSTLWTLKTGTVKQSRCTN